MSPRAPLSAATCALLTPLLASLLLVATAAPARAVELYESTPAPRTVVIVPGPQTPPPIVVHRPYAQSVFIHTEIERREPPALPPREVPRRGAYDTPGSVILGVGGGGLFLFGGESPRTVPMAYVRAALAVDQAEFGLRLGYAPDALGYELDDPAGGPVLSRSAALWMASGTFAYRFLEDADIHPVLGAGLGAVISGTEEGQDAAAGFGVSLRAGLELAFPVDSGALAVGLDAEGMQIFGAEDALPVQAGTTLSLAAHMDYRF